MNFDTTASRFLRPPDVAASAPQSAAHPGAAPADHPAQRRAWSRRSSSAALWAYRHTQSNARFAVRTIEIDGAVHTPRAALDLATQRYVGLNLFQIDIARVQRDLGGLGLGAPHRHREEAAGHAAHQDHRARAGRAGAQRRAAAVRRRRRRRRSRSSVRASATTICRSSATPTGAELVRTRDAAARSARARPRALLARLRSVADPAARLRAVRPPARRGRLRERRRPRRQVAEPLRRAAAPRTTRRSNTRTSGSRIE